ncbi:MAG: hypothetical protein ACRC6I_16135, partial [Paracoccaceae bacterium]
AFKERMLGMDAEVDESGGIRHGVKRNEWAGAGEGGVRGRLHLPAGAGVGSDGVLGCAACFTPHRAGAHDGP